VAGGGLEVAVDTEITTKTYAFDLIAGGRRTPARVNVIVHDWTADRRRYRPCVVTISWEDRSIDAASWNVYRAFQFARRRLEHRGLVPYCFGACADVQVSGMLTDSGQGFFAYRMSQPRGKLGHPQVNIFESEAGLNLDTVAAQRSYLGARREEAARSERSVWARVREALVRDLIERKPLPWDKPEWRACEACGRRMPVVADRGQLASGEVAPLTTFTYVCPDCAHCSVGTPETWDADRMRQTACHECGMPLAGHYQCSTCAYPRGWVTRSCDHCGEEQPVDARHRVRSCEMFVLDCISCGELTESSCDCGLLGFATQSTLRP
jgi:hypothetical protein